jgi:hypothetical protein
MAIAAVVALALPVAALGAAPLTVAQYRAQANTICTNDGKQIDKLSTHLTLPQYLTAAVKISRASYNSLGRLSPPAALATYHAQLIANLESGFPIIDGLLARAKAGKLTIKQFEANKPLQANVVHENALWKKIGATACEG